LARHIFIRRTIMDIQALRSTAREALKGFCRVCPVCDGRACAGEVPGMGGTGTGSSFKDNLAALRHYRLNLRTLHTVTSVDASLELFGKKLSMPILGAPMAGVIYNMGGGMSEAQFISSVMTGCKDAGSLGMCGDGAEKGMYESGLEAIAACGGLGAAILKPRIFDMIVARIRMAEEAGAWAVGMDVDGAGLVTMALKGHPVGPKAPEELAELVRTTSLPFIVKGVMTPDEAEIAAKAGAAAIVVSNHGGRVLDHTPGTAEMLPAIAAKVKGKLKIFVDGGVRGGADVLKMLALGADAVLVGRPLITGVFGGGAEGVAFLLNKMKAELVSAMLLTGTASVKDVSPRVLSPQPC
jgi:4-hydroxymandelate oxidase